jgi:glyoxylase-like metal-dependent hydrolase (beta-lactamase superfamily II)
MTLHLHPAEGIHRIEDAYTNWFIVDEDGRLSVVDAGVPRSWDSPHAALDALGRGPQDVEAVVLTHAHFDHVGFAEKARSQLGVPVYVHENDVPLTRHPWRYDHERPRSLSFATQPQALPVAEFLRHCAFWPPPSGRSSATRPPDDRRGRDRDARPHTARRGPSLVARAATADVERNLGLLDALAQTGARTVLTRHGEPWTGGAEAAVAQARSAGSA